MGKPLLIIVLGIFAVFFGVKSIGGYDTEAEHLHGGKTVTVTCDGSGDAIGGMGFLTGSADQACSDEVDAQRGRSPLWIVGGLGVAFYGISQFRKARAA